MAGEDLIRVRRAAVLFAVASLGSKEAGREACDDWDTTGCQTVRGFDAGSSATAYEGNVAIAMTHTSSTLMICLKPSCRTNPP